MLTFDACPGADDPSIATGATDRSSMPAQSFGGHGDTPKATESLTPLEGYFQLY